ncbi:MAG: DUF4290 domain-containing protein [Bacteroidales bacterium]|nr:DUF4290 domain-containing protein [Bacteroidales bacterium]
MIDKNLYYNTLREPLRLPEYGRHVQEMVNYVKTIPNKEERNRLAAVIIQIMANFTPYVKDTPEHKAKLWNQLAQISNYELDIDYPVPIYKTEDFKLKRKKIPYPTKNTQLKHYGNISELLVQKLSSLPDTPEKQQMLIDLANHMKKQYLLYNKEAVSDEQILSDIRLMSKNNEMQLPEVKLNETRDILYKNKKNNNIKKNNKRK